MTYEHDELNRLRAEVAQLHKVVIDALAVLTDMDKSSMGAVQNAIAILETAPEPSDETLKLIEAQDGETK